MLDWTAKAAEAAAEAAREATVPGGADRFGSNWCHHGDSDAGGPEPGMPMPVD